MGEITLNFALRGYSNLSVKNYDHITTQRTFDFGDEMRKKVLEFSLWMRRNFEEGDGEQNCWEPAPSFLLGALGIQRESAALFCFS